MARKNKSRSGKSAKGFITNLRKSAGSLAKDTAKDLMPNLSSTIKNNARFIKTTYQDTSSKFKETDLKENYLFKSGNDLIKNAMSDIRTGNINNKERQQKNTEDPFAKLLNFNFDSEDDLSDMFADDKSAPDTLSDLSDLSLDLDAETKNDIKTMANFSQANTRITNRGFAAMTTQLRSISAFQNQNTLKFYEMVEEKLNAMENHLNISSAYYKDLVENTKRSHEGPKSASLESAFDMKGFNIEDYVEIYKENFKGMFEAGSMVGSMMIKPMIADIVNNPLGALGKMGMKSLIPKGIKNSLKDFDQTLGMLPILLQGKIPGMKKRGGLWEMFGNLLDLNKSRVSTKKNEFVKGPVPFDGITKRAITHVIPGYLKRILFAITGNPKDKIVYDMNAGRFIEEKDAKREYRERFEQSRRSAIDGNIDSLEKEYIKALKDKKVIKNDAEGSSYLEDLRASLANLSKTGRTLSNDISASELSSDKKTAKILKDVISNMDSKSFNETNRAIANAFMQYQQELRSSTAEDLWSSTFDKGGHISRQKEKPNPIFDNIEKMTSKKDSAFKKFVLNNIKNEKLREGMAWLDKETEDGKNEALDKFNERILNSFKGDINYDKNDFKKKKSSNKKGNTQSSAYIGILQTMGADASDPAVRKVLKGISEGQDPATFKATVNRIISGAKGGINFANQGLFQYMTNTPEGLAIRVKIADGTVVPTTEGPNDPKTVEKNIITRRRANDKINKSDGKVIKLSDYKKKSTASTSAFMDEMEQQLPMVVGGNETSGIIENSMDPRYTIFGELFRDVTGSDLSKAGIFGMATSRARRAISNHKYGDLVMKYGERAYEGGKEYAKEKNLWDKFKDSSLGIGLKGLYKGSSTFANKLKNKGLDKGGSAFATGLDLLNFVGDRTGLNKDVLLGKGKDAIGFAGDTLGGLLGGVGAVLGGTMTVKDGAKGLAKGGWSTFKTIKKNTFKGFGRVGNIFKDGGLKEMKNIIKTKRNRVKPTDDPTTNLLLASNQMAESVDTSTRMLQLTTTAMTTAMNTSVEKMTEKMEDMTDVIEVSAYKVVESDDSDGGLVENVIGEVVGESIGGNALSVIGGAKGKKGILGRLGGLFGKGKGLLGKGAGLASKAFGAIKGAGILGKGASMLGGLASGAGGLLASGGSALAGLAGATPLLAGLAPVLGPALAVGAGAFGIGKLFKGWREKRKAKKEAEREQYYDENGNYKLDSEGYSTERGFFSKLFRPFGHKPNNKKLDQLNQAVPVTIIDKNNDSTNTIEEQKEKKLSPFARLSNTISDMRNRAYTNLGINPQDPMGTANNMTLGNPFMAGVKAVANTTPFGMMTKGFKNMFFKPAYADGVDESNKNNGQSSEDDMTGMISSNPNERTAAYVKPWGEYVMSPTFGNIFGANGLFGAMYKGLKKAAGGGGVSKLTEFFKNFWTNASNPGGSNGDASTEFSVSGDAMTADNYIGMYSNKHEGDVGTISSGKGDPGGASYGLPQFPINQNAPQEFVNWMKTQEEYKDLGEKFNGTKQGSAAFNKIWQDLAKTDYDRFGQAQVKYATVMDLEPFLKADKSGVNWNRSRALQEVAYSRSVHNGPYGFAKVTKAAGVNNNMTDAEIITRIYDHTRDNVGSYWRSSSSAVQNSIRKRMVTEKETMLKLAATNSGPLDWKGDGSIATASSSGTGTFTQPVPGHTSISSGYGNRIHPVTKKQSFHSGIDIPAPNGTKIVASDSGTVTHAGTQGTYGKLVKISHANGYETRYAHCSSIDVKKGASVKKGQAIAKVGSTGRSTGNHLHFEIRKNGEATNPTTYLKSSTSGGAKGGPDEPAIATPMSSIGDFDSSNLNSAINQVSRTMSKYNIVLDPDFESGNYNSPSTSSSSSYSVNNSQTFRDETRNNIMLKIKDVVETISQNTGKTNEILTAILQRMMDSANTDAPLQLEAELASLYRGF